MSGPDLLPPDTDLLLELLDLLVAVLLLFVQLPVHHVTLHQLNSSDERLRDAEVSILLREVNEPSSIWSRTGKTYRKGFFRNW